MPSTGRKEDDKLEYMTFVWNGKSTGARVKVFFFGNPSLQRSPKRLHSRLLFERVKGHCWRFCLVEGSSREGKFRQG